MNFVVYLLLTFNARKTFQMVVYVVIIQLLKTVLKSISVLSTRKK